MCFSFHPSGNYWISSSRDGSVRVFDMRRLQAVQTHKHIWGPLGGPQGTIGGPQGTTIGGPQGTIGGPQGTSGGPQGGPTGGSGGPPSSSNIYEPTAVVLNPVQPHIYCVGDTGGYLNFFSLLQSGGPLCRLDNSGGPQLGYSVSTAAAGQSGGPPFKENAIADLAWAPHGASIASAAENRLLRLWGRGAPGAPIDKEVNVEMLLQLAGTGYFLPAAVGPEDQRFLIDRRVAAAAEAAGVAAAATDPPAPPNAPSAPPPTAPSNAAAPAAAAAAAAAAADGSHDEEAFSMLGLPQTPKSILLRYKPNPLNPKP